MKFCEIDLHPQSISSLEMGYLFEELIRRFSEISNETAGEHFTPREVIRLIVDLLIANDDTKLTGRGIIRQVYDPACGTGGMLALTEEALREFNPSIRVELFGQELNDESYAICRSDMLITGHDPENIAPESTLANDAHPEKRFHYMLSNPPYGVDWKDDQDVVKAEAESLGHEGRFGAGTPRVSDGQLLFLQHMISKMRDDEAGSRIGIVMNGSPLFTGGAASGESEIRRWILENDWVEAIVALPTNLFYNTDIQTFVWILSNRKTTNRRGKIQLIDASVDEFWTPLRKNLGQKNREIHDEARENIVRVYGSFSNDDSRESTVSKIFDVADFGYREIRIERPLQLSFQVNEERLARLRDEKAFLALGAEDQVDLLRVLGEIPKSIFKSRKKFSDELSKVFHGLNFKVGAPVKKAILNSLSKRDQSASICTDKKGNPEPDTDLRDHEVVPLKEDWREYFEREVKPFAPDAWVDEKHIDKTDKQIGRVGYEVNFNRHFRPYRKPREIDDIDKEIFAILDSLAKNIEEMRI
nr:N-6 DNA methylase [Palleronia pontilimi]